ncbi:hypothetical protein EDD21DRAFT_334778 [Dissophora ornata]|nr:hypothetical protein EDD21DRAFT_334778 [Dissophora ornata]
MAAPSENTCDPEYTSEVGNVFAHDYYTFLNKEPSRLHCFYNKNSTMSHGVQGEDPEICQGQQASADSIHSKILELDFEDCKVLVHSVDSQSSLNRGIMVQVLGEMSNKGGPSQKFVQTFFLAEQPKGYYVLNDIFRYLKDDNEFVEMPEAEMPEAEMPEAEMPEAEIIEEKKAPIEEKKPLEKKPDHKKHDRKAEKKEAKKDDSKEAKWDDGKESKKDDSKDARKDGRRDAKKDSEVTTSVPAAESTQPQAPTPSVAAATTAAVTPLADSASASTTAPTTAAAAATPVPVVAPAVVPAEPPKPSTWATLAATNSTQWGSHVAPAKGSSINIVQPTPKPQTPKSNGAQYQSRHQGQRPTGRDDFHGIYVKGIVETMSTEQLREAFSKFGPVKNLEFNPKRNCAFVDFETAGAVQAALKECKVSVGSDTVMVERHVGRAPHYQNGSGPHGRQGPPGGHRGGRPSRGGFQERKPFPRPEKVVPAVAVN